MRRVNFPLVPAKAGAQGRLSRLFIVAPGFPLARE
jgi:hypothetical protein